jgi:hypothetical protein
MEKLTRRIIGCLSMSLLLLAVPACGVDDGGQWVPVPSTESPGPAVSPVPGGTLPADPGQIPTPVSDRVSYIACSLPPAVDISLPPAEATPYYVDAAYRVCLGEQEPSPSSLFCWRVQAFEARALAVAGCFRDALHVLDVQGSKVMGREWRQKALPMLPAVWSRTPEDVKALGSAISAGLVHLLTGGTASQVPGAPLCFPKGAASTAEELEETKNAAVHDIQTLVGTTSSDLAQVVVALKKGVNAQIDHDLRLNVAVMFVEKPVTTVPVEACSFQAPEL